MYKPVDKSQHSFFDFNQPMGLHCNRGRMEMKLLKIAAKVVHSGRYIQFKLCSSCPYKAEVYETFENIWQLAAQLE